MSITFMQEYFPRLPNDCQLYIYKQIDYKPLPLFDVGSCVKLKTNDLDLFYILSGPRWNYKEFTWEYKCENPKFKAFAYTPYFIETRLH